MMTDWKAYRGMDKDTLEKQRAAINANMHTYESIIAYNKQKIAAIEEENNRYAQTIAKCKEALKAIGKAEQCMPAIEYETVVVVRKATHTEYIGKPNPTYYEARNYKHYAVVYFDLMQWNKLGIAYGSRHIQRSAYFKAKEKADFNAELFNCIQRSKATTVYLADGATINTASLKMLNVNVVTLNPDDACYLKG